MMKGTLDPTTLEKIEAFARRRRQLILVRGVCAVLAILLAGMMILALVDWQVLLPDEARWALSAVVYGGAIVAAWATAVRLLWRAPDARLLARFIEQVRPELREDLISAVELGDPRGRSAWDSEEFREFLQKNVAERMRDVEVRSLLSFKRIAPWAWAAAGMAGLCVALLLLPGLRFDHLLHRALRPLANLERISRVKVTILEPDPPERVVPQGDVVPVRVETAGPETRVVILETFVPGRKAERVDMKPVGGRRFEAGVAVSREPIAYRIRAGDAITRKFTLTAVPRPEAVAFHKTYAYPAYAGKAPRPVTEENGDLVELEGTTVDLEVEVNQEVRAAELRLEQAGKSAVVPLRATPAPRRVRATIPITASGTYRLHLVAQGTDFENKFSPQYEIRAVPDLIPRISLDDPTQDQIAPPDEDVNLRGTAKDDLGLKRVIQMVRVNQADWTETVLAEDAGVHLAIVRKWELFDLRVQPGDRVTTKLVAIDLKGNRAESAPLHVVISAPGFDPHRLVPLAAKEGVFAALEELRKAAQALEKRTLEVLARPAGDDLERRQALLNALADAEKVAQEEEVVESRAKDALRVVRGAREASDLVLAARLARRLREDALQAGRADVEKASSASDAASAKAALTRAAASFKRVSELAEAAEAYYRDILSGEESIAVLNDLKDLARDQAAIHRQASTSAAARDAKVWERLSRRQGVAISQATAVEDVLGVLVLHAPEGQARRASKLRQDLSAARKALEEKLKTPPDASLDAPSQALRQQVDRALAEFYGLENELARRAVQAREALEARAETQTADVRDAGRLMQVAADHQRRLADLQAKNAPLEVQLALAKDHADRAALRWKAAKAQLEACASVEEARRESDPFFVADTSLAARALQAMLDAHQASPDAERSRATLAVIEKAYRTLETGHALADLASGLRELAEIERWGGPIASASTRHPKDWQWMDAGVKTLEAEFKEAGFPPEAAQELLKAWKGPAGNTLRKEMADRAAPGRRPGPAAPSLERLGGDVGRAVVQIQPPMEAARKELLKLVPSLPERLQELARAAERLKEKTSTLADKAPQSEPAQVRPEARQLLENQQGLDKQIEDVVAELRRDANTQDLFTDSGRERARDADDAIAMLRQSPPKAEDHLGQAAAAPQSKAQEQALDRAAEQQGKLADALKTLAEHYRNVEAKKPEETRPELRKAEEALGLKEQLDKQYAQMAKLAELAQESQQEALRQALEDALPGNEAMRRELAQLTQNALDRAEQALQDAARQERQAAQRLENAAQQAKPQAAAAELAKKIAEEARRIARQDVPQIAKEAQQAKANAQPPLDQAKQNLEEGAAAVPQDLSKPAPAAQGLEKAAQELQQAAQDLQGAEKAAMQAGQQAQQAAQAEGQQAQAAQKAVEKAMQKAQAAQQAAQKEAQEAKAAEQASQAAQQKAQAAQKAAQQNPADAAAQEAAQKAAQKAQAAQQAAQAEGQQAQAAQKAAEQAQGEVGQAQKAAQAKGQQSQAAQAAQQQAQSAQQNAGKAAQKAADLAKQAQQLAQQLRGAEQAEARALAQAAQQQGPVGELAREAQADLQQAARNTQAMGQKAQSQALEGVAKGVEGVGRNEVPAAQQAAAQGKSAAQAQPAVQAAEKAIQAQAQALAQARAATPNPQGEPAEGSESALSEAAAQFMAQALNALNAQGKLLDTAQGKQPGPPAAGQQPGSPSPAQQALQSAAQAQAQSMMQGRNPGQGQQPGQEPGQQPFSQSPGAGKGAAVSSGRLPEGVLPQNLILKPGDWGKLPPRLARDLMEAQRESVGGEYRNMVETYFRVIAERARK